MLYAVTNDGWAPGTPLAASETRSGLYRTRADAEAIAAGRRLVAVSVRYDATRCVVTPTQPAGRELPGGWSAPAILGPGGGVTSLAAIPAPLVRDLGPSRLRIHPGHEDPPRPHFPRGKGWARLGRER